MKVKFQVGAEMDLLNKDELAAELSKFSKSWREEIARNAKFRKFSAQASVANGAWRIGGGDNPNNNKDALGPEPGFVWSVRRIAVSGPGFINGTDTFSAYVDDVSSVRLIEQGISGTQQWDTAALVLYGPEQLVLAGSSSSAAASSGPTTIVVAQPAAGADWTVTVPAGETWYWQSWRAQLTTDANVASRSINYVIEQPTTFNDLALYTATVGQAASTTVVYQGTKGIGELPAVRNGGLQMMFPDGITLEAGTRIRSITQNIQAGDQWSAIYFSVVRTASATALAAGDFQISMSGQAIELPVQLAHLLV